VLLRVSMQQRGPQPVCRQRNTPSTNLPSATRTTLHAGGRHVRRESGAGGRAAGGHHTQQRQRPQRAVGRRCGAAGIMCMHAAQATRAAAGYAACGACHAHPHAGEQPAQALSSLVQGRNRRQVEGCTRRCVPTCTRGGEGGCNESKTVAWCCCRSKLALGGL
jgi:hypothetical protein